LAVGVAVEAHHTDRNLAIDRRCAIPWEEKDAD
jgi:hypothetical protein